MHGYGMNGWNMDWMWIPRTGVDHRSGADIPATKVKAYVVPSGACRYLANAEEARQATMTVYGQRSRNAVIVTKVSALLNVGAAVQPSE